MLRSARASLRATLAAQTAGMPATFWWLWSGALVSALATFVFPFLTLYLSGHGFDAQRIGLLVSLLGVGAVFAGPLAGTIADRFGRRPAVLGSLVVTAAAAAYLALVRDPLLVAPGVLLYGLASSMGRPAINATVADLLPEGHVARGFALLYWANNLGIGVSALIGGMLASKSWLGLFLVDALTTAVFAAVVWKRVPESRPAPSGAAGARGWSTVLRDRTFAAFLLAQLGFGVVFWQFMFAVPLAMKRQGLGAERFGQVVAVNCLLCVLVQPLAARQLSRHSPTRVLALASLLMGAGYGAYALCTTTLQYLWATGLWSLGEVLGLPAASALVARLAPPDLRGRYQGSFTLTYALSMTLAPIAGGAIIARAGTGPLWLSCAAVGLCVASAQLSLDPAQRARPLLERAE